MPVPKVNTVPFLLPPHPPYRMYAGKLEFLPASHSGHTTDGKVCYAGCETCENAASFCANNPISLGKERRKGGGRGRGIFKGEDNRSKDEADEEDEEEEEHEEEVHEEEEEEPRWQTWSTKFHSLIAVGVTARSRLRPEGTYLRLTLGSSEVHDVEH